MKVKELLGLLKKDGTQLYDIYFDKRGSVVKSIDPQKVYGGDYGGFDEEEVRAIRIAPSKLTVDMY